MKPRAVLNLSLIGIALLIGIAILHGSGYRFVAEEIGQSDLPDFLKRVLPPLYLYPSALMGILAVLLAIYLRSPKGLPVVLGVIAVIVAANAVLGFLLGGLVPGGVLLIAAGLFGFASRKALEAADSEKT